MRYVDLRCIRCGRSFTTDSPEGWSEDGPPNGGLIFISYGNYGSTVYDPQGNGEEYLVIVLCDQCAVSQASPGVRNILHVCKPLPRPPPPPRYRGPWSPPELAFSEEMKLTTREVIQLENAMDEDPGGDT